MKVLMTATLLMVIGLFGCGAQKADAPQAEVETEAAPATATKPAPAPNYDIPMRNFAGLTIGPYAVQPMFEEEIKDGHYNIKVEGAPFKAVRMWVGQEDPGDVMVVKAMLENDYQHGHIEIPDPVPADLKLWIEIEDEEGMTYLGSTALAEAQ